MSRRTWLSVSGVVAVALSLGAGSCSSGGGSGAGSSDHDGVAGGRGGGDATVGCSTDADCAASVPTTTPANCAAGKCNALEGVCEYVAKDEDGDGHPAAFCESTNGVPIQEGDDCNDQDPNLYPGHPESCQLMPDGGADAGYCTPGQISCLPNGAESTCNGACTPCDPTDPNAVACDGTQPQACNTSGTGWVNLGQACDGACLNGKCVACNPGAPQCSSSGLQTCDGAGNWGSAVACTGATPVCLSGACVACSPGARQCASGSTWQVCGSDLQWGSAAACSSGSTCTGGVCETTTGTSCQTSGAGRTTCGVSGESCCTSIEVPGGTYYRTYTNSGSGPTGEADPASVGGLRLDKYLVTVGRFRQFVSAWNGGSGWMPPAGSGKHTHLNSGNGLNATGGGYEPGWVTADNSNIGPTSTNLSTCGGSSVYPYATWTPTAGSNENLPIDCVNWYESYAFCIWDGGFLPSEAEWEYAAAGGSQQREYPWGTTVPGTACPGTGCSYAVYDCYYPNGSGSCSSGVGTVAPVGYAALGAGLWGQLDLAGEVWEWDLDWYDSYVDPCTDCANFTTSASGRVIRGGVFVSPASILLPPYRSDGSTSARGGIGLRCARTP